MGLLELYHDRGVPYEEEGGKHTTHGWVSVACPFCHDVDGKHLGATVDTWHFHCWRCGSHDTLEALCAVLRVDRANALRLTQLYGRGSASPKRRTNANKIVRAAAFRLPPLSGALNGAARAYLESRGFDPERLAAQWGLQATGPVSSLDGIDYRFRIVIPITWNGDLVSFQSRDYTGKAERRYMACPPGREVLPHKHILYGDQRQWGDTGICVEGPADVWRLGGAAFATSGIEFTSEQVLTMADHFKRVFVLFDPERVARTQARILIARLRGCGIAASLEPLPGVDPADLPQAEADRLVQSLLRRT